MKLNTVKRIAAELNTDVFGELLELPRFHFTRNRRIHGEYDGVSLAVNPHNDTDDMIETIYHELIHVFIDTVLNTDDNAEHGVLFCAWYSRLIPDYIRRDDV